MSSSSSLGLDYCVCCLDTIFFSSFDFLTRNNSYGLVYTVVSTLKIIIYINVNVIWVGSFHSLYFETHIHRKKDIYLYTFTYYSDSETKKKIWQEKDHDPELIQQNQNQNEKENRFKNQEILFLFSNHEPPTKID